MTQTGKGIVPVFLDPVTRTIVTVKRRRRKSPDHPNPVLNGRKVPPPQMMKTPTPLSLRGRHAPKSKSINQLWNGLDLVILTNFLSRVKLQLTDDSSEDEVKKKSKPKKKGSSDDDSSVKITSSLNGSEGSEEDSDPDSDFVSKKKSPKKKRSKRGHSSDSDSSGAKKRYVLS